MCVSATGHSRFSVLPRPCLARAVVCRPPHARPAAAASSSVRVLPGVAWAFQRCGCAVRRCVGYCAPLCRRGQARKGCPHGPGARRLRRSLPQRVATPLRTCAWWAPCVGVGASVGEHPNIILLCCTPRTSRFSHPRPSHRRFTAPLTRAGQLRRGAWSGAALAAAWDARGRTA